MFDILVYLFENYVHADACPEPAQLARKLTAAGFEEEEISEALEWLSGLRQFADNEQPSPAADSHAIRVYVDEEQSSLGTECRGFLQFMESAGVLDPVCREMIIERALALPDSPVSLAKLKVIVLMVLWQHDRPMDGLILDELLTEDDEDEVFLPLLH
ncbi:MAG: DUF494 domain-containing protein [Zoogloea sp.]|nr:DUF494 domain-containing protein [Zoogloea sp.]